MYQIDAFKNGATIYSIKVNKIPMIFINFPYLNAKFSVKGKIFLETMRCLSIPKLYKHGSYLLIWCRTQVFQCV